MALSNTFRIDHDRVGFIFNVFLTKTTLTTHLLYIFLKYMTSFWSLILFFFIDGFFIFRLESVFLFLGWKRQWQRQQGYQHHKQKYHLTVLQTVLETVLAALLAAVL